MSKQLSNDEHEDYFYNVVSKYPVAWAALQRLWTNTKRIAYPPVSCEPYQLEELSEASFKCNTDIQRNTIVKIDGIDSTLSGSLWARLRKSISL